MPTRFMTDPHEMRSMAGRFDVHAQTVEDEARKMWASIAEHCRCRLERYRADDLLRHHGPDESGVPQHRQHAARGAGRADPRRQQLETKSRPLSRSCAASDHEDTLGEHA